MTSTSAIVADRLITEFELADRQRRSVKTIRNDRVRGNTIPFIKIGRLVRYRLTDVEAWEKANQFGSTSEHQAVYTERSSVNQTSPAAGGEIA